MTRKIQATSEAILERARLNKKAVIVAKLNAGKSITVSEQRFIESEKDERGKLGTAKNIGAAVSITGLSETLIRLARDKGCQAIRANGNIQCDELIDYIAAKPELRRIAEAIPDYKLEKALDLRESRLLKEQRRLKLAEKLVTAEEVIREWTRYIFAAKNKLRQAESALAAEAGMRLGLSSEQVAVIKEIHRTHSRRILNELHQGKWG